MTQAINIKDRQSKLKRFQKFVFIGSNAAETSLEANERLHLDANSSLLAQAEIGSLLVIRDIYADKNIARQLKDLRVKSGKIVKLISKTGNGSVVISTNERSIGIGTKIARQIVVTVTDKTL